MFVDLMAAQAHQQERHREVAATLARSQLRRQGAGDRAGHLWHRVPTLIGRRSMGWKHSRRDPSQTVTATRDL
jgi:hypothetical protein